jgi:multidrug efflux pump
MLTLYTTPVVYLYLDRFSLWTRRLREGSRAVPNAAAETGD